jgi:FixJ family two-component response regulator
MVYVVDDDADIRDGLISLIRSAGLGVTVFGTAQEFLRHSRGDTPSCVVLDVNLPDGSGLEIPARLEQAGTTIPIIFITGHGTIPMSVSAMKAGAMEFLTKPFRNEELITAVRAALDRDHAMLADRGQLAGLKAGIERLTPRERDVLALMVTGKLNKQIAGELGIDEHGRRHGQLQKR